MHWKDNATWYSGDLKLLCGHPADFSKLSSHACTWSFVQLTQFLFNR